ncbi:MAG: sigma-70 family RNA polymerase sigma factor [Lachnospiraceae bacterium]|nr:sigma-70 family RNA polymerase sigma factor [Lachnospiraceae bacterium]
MKSSETKFWVKKAQRHDKDAFTELMQLYMKDMYRTAIAILMNEEDAADALQDTILTCWEKLHTLKKPEFFKTWMTRILINHCYDIIRKSTVYENIESYEEPSKSDEYNIELKEAYASIDERYRLPMELYYSQGFRIREIAEMLSVPQNTIKTRLSRGRKQLEEYYREEDKNVK